MNLMDNIYKKASSNKKRIVLVETEDIRILEAASLAVEKNLADIVLLGEAEKINSLAAENGLDLSSCEIISVVNNEKLSEFAQEYYQLRKHKGISLEDAELAVQKPINFAAMLVHTNYVDGMVAGAVHSTAEVLRSALQIVGTDPNSKLVSTFFIMQVPNTEYGEAGIFAFSDAGMVENPNSEQLSEIAISTANSFKSLLEIEPKVALLSYSSKGSGKSEMVNKVVEATELAKAKAPYLAIDGELQVDAAIDEAVAKQKVKDSEVAGQANVLIFPDLNSGNIAYKLVQRLAKADAFGPVTQGLAKPVNDLSRGSSVEDILGVIAITAVQAQIN